MSSTHVPAPDPAIGKASLDQIALAKQEYEDQQKLVQQYAPLYADQVQAATDAQTKATARSDDQYNDYVSNFRPLEQQYAATAQDYASGGRKEQAAQEAEGSVATSFDTARAQQSDQLQAAGVQAGSGKALALNNALGLQEAVAKAGAANTARTNVENTGLNLMGSAINVGRGLGTTSLQQAGAAQGSGAAAQGSVSGLSGLTAAGLQTSSGAMTAGINGGLAYNQAQQGAAQANNAAIGDTIGAVAGIAGMFLSSKKLKNKVSRVDGKEALQGLADDDSTKVGLRAAPADKGSASDQDAALKGLTTNLPVDGWRYKKGVADEGEHVGPYAEDVQRNFGDRVAPGGKAIDMGAMSQINGQGIQALTRKVLELKRELKSLEAA